jgi:hypothetical protein
MPLSVKSKLGLGTEASWGAGAEPAVNLPVEPFNLMFAFDSTLDQSIRGEVAMDFGVYQGVYSVEGDISGHIFPNEIGYLLTGFFGEATTTGTTSPYEHTFTVKETPKSLAITDYVSGVATYQYRGVYVSEFGFSFSAAEGLLDYTANLVGKSYANTTATVPAADANDAMQGWRATIKKGGVSYAKLIEFEATMSREVTLVYTASNTQVAYAAYVGPMEATGTMTLDFSSATDLNNYLNNTEEAFVINFTNGTDQFQWTASKMNYASDPAEIDRSNVNLQLILNWRALHNNTDSGPCQILLANSTSTYL